MELLAAVLVDLHDLHVALVDEGGVLFLPRLLDLRTLNDDVWSSPGSSLQFLFLVVRMTLEVKAHCGVIFTHLVQHHLDLILSHLDCLQVDHLPSRVLIQLKGKTLIVSFMARLIISGITVTHDGGEMEDGQVNLVF